MEGVLYFFNWKEFGNMSDRFPGHPGGIECLAALDELSLVTGCEDGKIRFVQVMLLRHSSFTLIARRLVLSICILIASYRSLVGRVPCPFKRSRRPQMGISSSAHQQCKKHFS